MVLTRHPRLARAAALTAVLALTALAAPAFAKGKRGGKKAPAAKASAAAAAPAKQGGGALARTHALIAAFLKVKKPAKGKTLSAADKAANKAAFAELDGFYDRGTFVSRPIAKHVAKFSPAQKKTFEDTFYDLIRLISYADSARFFRSSKWKASYSKATGGRNSSVVVHATLADESETDIVFSWARVGGAFRIVSVRFDGASMLDDYAAQFGKIIAKHGVDGLNQRLAKRLAKERKRRAGMLP